MSYRDFDFEEEGRDDVIRREIEAADKDEKEFWDWPGVDETETFDQDGSVW